MVERLRLTGLSTSLEVTFMLTGSLVLALVIGLLSIAPAVASSNDVVISEFRFHGPTGGNDEFVELRNASNATVDISG